ncbi:MAG: hypothetical protein ABI377_01720 [Devosia sp.]
MLRYEAAIKSDGFIVMAHGSTADVARAKAILGTTNASHVDVHASNPALATSCMTASPNFAPGWPGIAARWTKRDTDSAVNWIADGVPAFRLLNESLMAAIESKSRY